MHPTPHFFRFVFFSFLVHLLLPSFPSSRNSFFLRFWSCICVVGLRRRGGPRDPSVLTLFAEHVAHNIWTGECWIYEHFPNVYDCVTNDAYDETFPRACRWLTTKTYMKGLPIALYRTRLDALTITDVCWMPYGDHRGVRGFDLSSCF